MHAHDRPSIPTGPASYIIYVAAVLSIAMILFPPFTSLSGTEYAFLLTGPGWLTSLAPTGADLGVGAHIYWSALLVQLGTVWALALGARWFLRQATPSQPPTVPALLVGCLSLLCVPAVTGQTPEETSEAMQPGIDLEATVGAQSGPYGVGTGSSWPAYGISGTYRYSEQITAEVILGVLGTVQSFAGRGWYRFKQDPTYDVYGFATAGIFRYDYTFDTESVLGLGGGVGLELSWAKILDDPDFPPIYSNIDLGLILANFEYYNWSGFSMGGGVHYRFGGK